MTTRGFACATPRPPPMYRVPTGARCRRRAGAGSWVVTPASTSAWWPPWRRRRPSPPRAPSPRHCSASGWTSGSVVLLRVGGAALILLGPALFVCRGRWHLVWAHRRTIAVFGLPGRGRLPGGLRQRGPAPLRRRRPAAGVPRHCPRRTLGVAAHPRHPQPADLGGHGGVGRRSGPRAGHGRSVAARADRCDVGAARRGGSGGVLHHRRRRCGRAAADRAGGLRDGDGCGGPGDARSAAGCCR